MLSKFVSQPSCWLLVLLTTVLLTSQPDTDRATATFKSERVATVALPFPLDAQRQTLTLKTYRAGEDIYVFWQDRDNNRILLNNKLEVLGELPFIESGYALLPAFVHEKGLALLRSPYHAEYHEDYLTFDIFRFE